MCPWVVHACPSPTCRHAIVHAYTYISTGEHSPMHTLLLMAKCSIPALTVQFVHNSDKRMRVLWLSRASPPVECCRSTFSNREGLESEKVCERWAVCLHTCVVVTQTQLISVHALSLSHTHARSREREDAPSLGVEKLPAIHQSSSIPNQGPNLRGNDVISNN